MLIWSLTIGVAAVIILVAVGHGSAVAVSNRIRGARHERRYESLSGTETAKKLSEASEYGVVIEKRDRPSR